MKRIIIALLLILAPLSANAGSNAKQIDFLLAGYRHPTSDAVLSGGKVKTFLTGTSTLSSLWTDQAKGGVATNPVVLDSSGKAEVYGDNLYKFEIYDSDDVLLETISGLRYVFDIDILDEDDMASNSSTQGVTQSSLVGFTEGLAGVSLSRLGGDIHDAITAIGATETTLVIDIDTTMTKDDTIPSTLTLKFVRGNIIDGSWTLTISGPLVSGIHQIFDPSLTVDIESQHITEVYPQYWGATGDGVTNDYAAVQAMFDSVNASGVFSNPICFFPAGDYSCETTLTPASGTIIHGAGPITSGAYSSSKAVRITGKHTGTAVMALIGTPTVVIKNLELYGSAATTPKTVLTLGRSSAASAGWHIFENIRVAGYSTLATLYAVASESNVFRDCWIDNAGGGAKYTYWTGQSDNLAIGGLTGSSNLHHLFINTYFTNASSDSGASTLYIAGGASSGIFKFDTCFLSAYAGWYVTLETGSTDGQDFTGGIKFINSSGESAAGGAPHGVISFLSSTLKSIENVDFGLFPVIGTSDFFIGTDYPTMSLKNIRISAEPDKPSIFPNIEGCDLSLRAENVTTGNCNYSSIAYSSASGWLYHVGGVVGNNIINDLAGINQSLPQQFLSNSGYWTAFGKQKVGWHSAAPSNIAWVPTHWRRGDVVWNTGAAASGSPGWVCITSGTFDTESAASTTGGITSGTAVLTVASATDFLVSSYITIAGVTGTFQILKIEGLVFTLDGNADATVAGAAVATPDPSFKAMANLAA